jgi:hypothetical protein
MHVGSVCLSRPSACSRTLFQPFPGFHKNPLLLGLPGRPEQVLEVVSAHSLARPEYARSCPPERCQCEPAPRRVSLPFS